MINEECDHLFTRKMTSIFEDKIINYLKRDERNFSHYIERIFDRKRAVYGQTKNYEDEDSRFSRLFYHEFYKEPDLHFGSLRGVVAHPQEFIEEIILRKGEVHRNFISYLLGEIGVGKTAFINWLITNKLETFVKEQLIWFVRVDVEQLTRARAFSPQELVYGIINNIVNIIARNNEIIINSKVEYDNLLEIYNKDASNYEKSNFIKICNSLCKFANKIQQSSGRRFILILDNIDFICHLNDQGLYYDIMNSNEQHIHLSICNSLKLFERQQPLSDLGTNIIVVTRQDSYNIISKFMTTNTSYEDSSSHNNIVYVLTSPGWKVALTARCNLLNKCVQQELDLPRAKRNKYLRIPKYIVADLNSGKPNLAEHLAGITDDGLRKMMEFFAQYGWIKGVKEKPKFIHSYPVGLIAFMLNKRPRFSELNSQFPNIYLNNKLTTPRHPFTKDHEHRHTYWLKRLILHLIDAEEFEDIVDVIDLFNNGERGYEECLIKDCLGNLTDAFRSYCLIAIRDTYSTIPHGIFLKNIKITRRGRHCLKFIFDRFFYLQLIVEEPYLPLPRIFQEEFNYKIFDHRKLNYGYITDERRYKTESREMIKIKSRQVLLFLEVLDLSYELEREFYHNVFEKLEKRNVKLPDTKKVKASVINEIAHISSSLVLDVDLPNIKELINSKREKLRHQLREAYQVGFNAVKS